MVTRHRGREVALQMLFQYDASGIAPDQVVELYRNCFAEGSLPDEFSIGLFHAVTGNIKELDAVIEKSSDNWRLERMSLVDRNILRIGVNEILSAEDIPARVAINESVELAKRFGTTESPAFVNGILDRVARDERKI
ncbi:MAG: transcription antitermination factor NusB [Proteobacteria bacterium]|nr:transcription antitermination factor NusB [Pseudomonadota bacterium]